MLLLSLGLTRPVMAFAWGVALEPHNRNTNYWKNAHEARSTPHFSISWPRVGFSQKPGRRSDMPRSFSVLVDISLSCVSFSVSNFNHFCLTDTCITCFFRQAKMLGSPTRRAASHGPLEDIFRHRNGAGPWSRGRAAHAPPEFQLGCLFITT